MRLFVTHGIDAVSVRTIAEAVGMKASNLYAHFPGKQELIQELFAEGYAAYDARLRAVTGPTNLARLDAMVRLICELHDTDRTRFRFLLLSRHGGLPGVAEDGPNPIGLVQAVIAAAMAAGEIPPGDAALVTAMITGLVLEPAVFRHYGRLSRDLRDVEESLVRACRAVASQAFMAAA